MSCEDCEDCKESAANSKAQIVRNMVDNSIHFTNSFYHSRADGATAFMRELNLVLQRHPDAELTESEKAQIAKISSTQWPTIDEWLETASKVNDYLNSKSFENGAFDFLKDD